MVGCGGGRVVPPPGETTPTPTLPPTEPTTYVLSTTVSPSEAGSISPSSGEYESGVEVKLTASPASGYSFDYWSGDASGTQSIITVTMDSDKDIVANFHSSVVNPPIQVVLDFFGIKDIHQPPISVAPNRIQLYIVVDDGKTTWNFTYPRNGEGIVMDYFQLEDLRKQTIFQSLSVGDHLTISALAYSCADKEATLSVGKALQTFEPSMGPLLDFYERLPQSRELIGWYEHTWYTTDEWGTVQGRYEEEGRGDLRLWFRIWSNEELAPISKPRFVPDVKILDVTLPTDAKPGSVWIIGSKQYPITLSLMNNEEFDVPIKWEAESSMTGKFHHGEAIVPRNGKQLDITKYYWWEAGDRTITYTIYYSWNNAKLDTWSGTVSVTS
jgi:hypothetical protein